MLTSTKVGGDNMFTCDPEKAGMRCAELREKIVNASCLHMQTALMLEGRKDLTSNLCDNFVESEACDYIASDCKPEHSAPTPRNCNHDPQQRLPPSDPIFNAASDEARDYAHIPQEPSNDSTNERTKFVEEQWPEVQFENHQEPIRGTSLVQPFVTQAACTTQNPAATTDIVGRMLARLTKRGSDLLLPRREAGIADDHAEVIASSKSLEVKGNLPSKVRTEPVAPDGRWGWIVLAGAFYTVAFTISITTCFGILFSQRIKVLNISSSELSYVYMLHNITWNLGVLLTNTAVLKFGFRAVAFSGCLAASLSFMLLAFANSLAFIVIVYSIILPISAGVGSTVSFLIVPRYFEKRRGQAMAILMTGLAVGGIVSPLLIRNLQDEFGFIGATLIHGAIILNCCVASALFRPLESKKKERNDSLPPTAVEDFSEFGYNEQNGGFISTPTLGLERSKPIPSRMWIFASNLILSLTTWFKKNYSVLKQRKVLMNGFSLSTHVVGYFNFVMLVPFVVESSGHSPQYSAWCVAAFSVSNASVRLIVASLADRTWFNKAFFFGLGAFIASCTSFGFMFATHSELWMTILILVFGVGVGLYMSLYHVHMIDVLGMELYAAAVGVNAVIMASTFGLAGPIFGSIRKITTSYGASLGACSALLLCSTLLVIGLHKEPKWSETK
ncbi:monocarboxylate transporter 12-B [Hyalella azteca]|uniref:Monocarboxylate transporter 12-B n=1 Tax=Hyalella azteca TaxID=294128 RepID=A0A8B7PH27_HYAAZ|nr:monocarboxylate transporter 12-B [Hyalella azteca]